jgi:hypothetical protein
MTSDYWLYPFNIQQCCGSVINWPSGSFQFIKDSRKFMKKVQYVKKIFYGLQICPGKISPAGSVKQDYGFAAPDTKEIFTDPQL